MNIFEKNTFLNMMPKTKITPFVNI